MLRKAILCLLLSGIAQAQQSLPAIEPEFSDVFMALDAGRLVPLEREATAIHAGGGGFMVAGAKAAYEIPGPHSNVRFHSGQQLEFVVRSPLAIGAVDPNSFFVLRRLDAKKKGRELIFMKGHFSPIGGSAKTDPTQGAQTVVFSRYGTGSYKLSVAALEPGEYALGPLYPQTVFCFGVD